ncbi:MAG: sulfotransferase family protein [Paracoccaceae bacterium]
MPELQVIGAGFGRTGTDSLREALNILGFGPCHHMFEVTANPVMKARWRAFLAEGGAPDWEALFEGYRSCVDWPSAHWWPELASLCPAAKVILTWRDPESWWRSFEETLLAGYRTASDRESVGVRIMEKVFGDRIGDRDHAITLYEANAAAARALRPEGRVLVLEPGAGWEPLCTHLGVPVPDLPYPNRNSAGDIRSRVGIGAPGV